MAVLHFLQSLSGPAILYFFIKSWYYYLFRLGIKILSIGNEANKINPNRK